MVQGQIIRANNSGGGGGGGGGGRLQIAKYIESMLLKQIPMDHKHPSINLFIIRTLHDCPSQMNENLLISNSKLTSDSELIW